MLERGWGGEGRVLRPSELVFEAGVADVNVAAVADYMDASRIARKLLAYAAKYTPEVALKNKDLESIFRENVENAAPQRSGLARLLSKKSDSIDSDPLPTATQPSKSASASPLFLVRSLLDCLLLEPGEARILLREETLEFFLLNPGRLFKSVVWEAESVLLAGGTMEPSGELICALTDSCQLPKERIHRFSCGHVVHKSQFLALVLGCGLDSKCELRFDFANRSKPQLLREVVGILDRLMRVVPAGCVVFVPSYDYLDLLYTRLSADKIVGGSSGSETLGKKRIFREPRQAELTQKVWAGYSRSAVVGAGAVLFAVVGGKMSEGINFADDLGRCVLVVGLPYPNSQSPILKERMRYLDSVRAGGGREHYEALCLRAVNQSIGRAIRHRRDHAAILLLDLRYAQPRIRSQLPAWIASSIPLHPTDFGAVVRNLAAFYATQKPP